VLVCDRVLHTLLATLCLFSPAGLAQATDASGTTHGNFQIISFPTDSSQDSTGRPGRNSGRVMKKLAPVGSEPRHAGDESTPTTAPAGNPTPGMTAVARDLGRVRLGIPWSGPVDDCDTSRGSLSPSSGDHWIYRCRTAFTGVNRTAFIFVIPGRDRPTLERVRYTLKLLPRISLEEWRSARRALLDALSPVVDGWAERKPEAEAFRNGGEVDVEADPGPAGAPPESIGVEYQSYWLRDQMDPVEWNLAETERAEKEKGRAREILVALKAHHSALAAVLSSTRATLEQIRTMRSELARALDLPHQSTERDLVLLAAHLWTRQFAESLTKGRCADTDSTVLHDFNAAFASFGGPLECGYDDIWCYPGFLADSLASRAGADRWTDFAFLQRMEEGWSPACGPCGYDSVVGPEQYKPVIARGMAYLHAHPSSRIAPEVRLMVAEAHETAWDLAAVNESFDELHDPEAASHRIHAIEIYETYLKECPLDPRGGAVRLRLSRMRLGKYTSYERYWCLWD